MVCGSSAAGKTNFTNLLLGDQFIHSHEPTVLTSAKSTMVKQIIATKSEQNFVTFKKCDPEYQIVILQSHLYQKFLEKKQIINNDLNGKESLPQPEDISGQSSQQEILEDVPKPVGSETKSEAPPEHEQSHHGSDTQGDDDFARPDVLSTMYESDIEKKLANLIPAEVEELPEPWDMLTFLDTGGQPEYVNMLPAVSSSVMVTFVVLSLEYDNLLQNVNVFRGNEVNKKPAEKPLKQLKEEPTVEPYSYIDLIKMLVSMQKPQMMHIPDDVLAKKADKKSYLSFIGTKSDIVDQLDKVVDMVDKDLRSHLEEACVPDILTFVSGKHLTAISNCNAGDEENEDGNAKIIRSKLHKKLKEAAAIYNIPIAWLLLELEMKRWCDKNERSYMKFQEVAGICSNNGLLKNNEENIKMFLKFYHILGVFLYYGEDGHDIVITDVQWFFKNLSKLVTFSTMSKDRFDHQRLLTRGLVTRKVFQDMQFDLSDNLGLDYFINIFQLLNIIAVLHSSHEEVQYFVPCILPTCNLESKETLELLDVLGDRGNNHEVEPLLFQISGSKDCMEPLSQDFYYGFTRGLFCCLVVDLAKKNETSLGYLQLLRSTEYLHSNFIVFQYSPNDDYDGDGYSVVLLDRFIYLEIQVRRNKEKKNKVYHQIRDIIFDSLETVVKKLNFSDSCICVAFQCCQCKESHLTRNTIENVKAKRPFYCQPNGKQYKCGDSIWFEDFKKVSINICCCWEFFADTV